MKWNPISIFRLNLASIKLKFLTWTVCGFSFLFLLRMILIIIHTLMILFHHLHPAENKLHSWFTSVKMQDFNSKIYRNMLFSICIVILLLPNMLKSSRNMKVTTPVGWGENTSPRQIFMEVAATFYSFGLNCIRYSLIIVLKGAWDN